MSILRNWVVGSGVSQQYACMPVLFRNFDPTTESKCELSIRNATPEHDAFDPGSCHRTSEEGVGPAEPWRAESFNNRSAISDPIKGGKIHDILQRNSTSMGTNCLVRIPKVDTTNVDNHDRIDGCGIIPLVNRAAIASRVDKQIRNITNVAHSARCNVTPTCANGLNRSSYRSGRGIANDERIANPNSGDVRCVYGSAAVRSRIEDELSFL